MSQIFPISQSLVLMQASKRKKEKRHLREVKSKKEENLERKKTTKKSESIILQLHVLCCDVIGDDVMYFSNN